MIVGVGFDNLVGQSSPVAPAKAEVNVKASDLEIFNFDENINHRLREYDALIQLQEAQSEMNDELQ